MKRTRLALETGNVLAGPLRRNKPKTHPDKARVGHPPANDSLAVGFGPGAGASCPGYPPALATFSCDPAYTHLENRPQMTLTCLGLGYDARMYKGLPPSPDQPTWADDHPGLSLLGYLLLIILEFLS